MITVVNKLSTFTDDGNDKQSEVVEIKSHWQYDDRPYKLDPKRSRKDDFFMLTLLFGDSIEEALKSIAKWEKEGAYDRK